MEETSIMIMLKDAETGFLDRELGCYTVEGSDGIVFQVYAQQQEKGLTTVLKLSCEKELQDWEYEAVFDYYDTEALKDLVDTVEEEEAHLNPVWCVTFPFLEETGEMEERLTAIVKAHIQELESVYTVIADKEDEYCEA